MEDWHWVSKSKQILGFYREFFLYERGGGETLKHIFGLLLSLKYFFLSLKYFLLVLEPQIFFACS